MCGFSRVHAVCVCDDADYFYQHVDEQLHCLGLIEGANGTPLRARDMVDIIEGYKGQGYGKSTDEELGEWFCSKYVLCACIHAHILDLHMHRTLMPDLPK